MHCKEPIELASCDKKMPIYSTVGRGVAGIEHIQEYIDAGMAAVQVILDNINTQLESLVEGTVPDGAIITAKLADLAVTTEKLAGSSVTNSKIVSMSASKLTGTITAAQLAGGIENSKIDGMATSKLIGTITNAQLAGSITENKIVSLPTDKLTGTISNAQLASGISASKITTGTLDGDRIASQTINKRHMSKQYLQAGRYEVAQTTDWDAGETKSFTLNYDNFLAVPIVVVCMYTSAPKSWTCSVNEVTAKSCKLNITRLAGNLKNFGPQVAWIAAEPYDTV